MDGSSANNEQVVLVCLNWQSDNQPITFASGDPDDIIRWLRGSS